MGSQSLSPGLGDEAEAFPRSVAGREPALPICRDNACPGLGSRAPVWVRPQQEVGPFVLSLSPSCPAVPRGPVPGGGLDSAADPLACSQRPADPLGAASSSVKWPGICLSGFAVTFAERLCRAKISRDVLLEAA